MKKLIKRHLQHASCVLQFSFKGKISWEKYFQVTS